MDLTQYQSAAYFSSLLILWLSFLIIYPILTGLMKNKNTNWGKFWLVWFFTALITGLLLTFMILYPNIISSFINTIKSWFS